MKASLSDPRFVLMAIVAIVASAGATGLLIANSPTDTPIGIARAAGTDSMGPDYADDHIIVYVEQDEYRTGDVVVLKNPCMFGQFVSHRITRVDTEGHHTGVQTKGDWNDFRDCGPDGLIPFENIYGRVVFHW
jgi:signal peptidase I